MGPEAKQVLIIDDDAERRRIVAAILGDEGFAVTTATEGFSAIRAAGAERFALVLAAVSLPGTLDGPETVRHLRSRQPWLKALYTGDVVQRPWWPADERDDFIAAPFRRRDLLGCVFELLQRPRVAQRVRLRHAVRASFEEQISLIEPPCDLPA